MAVAQTGVLAGKARRAAGSTVLDDAVATQYTVAQLISGCAEPASRCRTWAGWPCATTTPGRPSPSSSGPTRPSAPFPGWWPATTGVCVTGRDKTRHWLVLRVAVLNLHWPEPC